MSEPKYSGVIRIHKTSDKVVGPVCKRGSAQEVEVFAFLEYPLTLNPGDSRRVSTGLTFEVPEGYEIKILPSSHLKSKKFLHIQSSPPMFLDSSYHEELTFSICSNENAPPFTLNPGEKLGDISIQPRSQPLPQEINQFPSEFHEFILLDRLAYGGMAEIFRAVTKDEINRVVVIKRTLPQYQTNPKFRKMFANEIQVSAKLNHPNIVHLHSYKTSGEYIEMEYVRGASIRDIFDTLNEKNEKIPIAIALYIIHEAAKGLYFAHQFKDDSSGEPWNLIHRDISPSNIMITYDGIVKICDFGISKISRVIPMTQEGNIKGKISYMSPEQARCSTLDHRTDMFSLGVVFWEMLTGKKLFNAEDPRQNLAQVVACNIPSPIDDHALISPQIAGCCLRALEKAPENRYASMDEFRLEITSLLKDYFPKKNIDLHNEVKNWMKNLFENQIEKDTKNLQNLLSHLKGKNSENIKTQVLEPTDSDIQDAIPHFEISESKKIETLEAKIAGGNFPYKALIIFAIIGMVLIFALVGEKVRKAGLLVSNPSDNFPYLYMPLTDIKFAERMAPCTFTIVSRKPNANMDLIGQFHLKNSSNALGDMEIFRAGIEKTLCKVGGNTAVTEVSNSGQILGAKIYRSQF